MKKVCPDCKGKGRIELFTTIARCDKCGGTGSCSEDSPPTLELDGRDFYDMPFDELMDALGLDADLWS